MMPPQPLHWQQGDATLTAMLHMPANKPETAILMIPGGSDYRIGSHRSYVRLAMALADAGHAVMRLDVSGMGDSSGHHTGFETLGGDIASALVVLHTHLPPSIKLYLWGQCDGASAILIGLGTDFQADGAILCNPWARDARTAADQLVRHHYRRRLSSRDSWRRLLSGQTSLIGSVKSVFAALTTLAQPDKSPSRYQERIITTLKSGRWPCLIVIGSEDAGGQEFRLFANKHEAVRQPVTQSVIAGGNHSFSTREQRQSLQNIACDWLEAQQNVTKP
jgi:uncharacterized protein